MMVMLQNFTEKQAENHPDIKYKESKLKVKSENHSKFILIQLLKVHDYRT